MQELLFPDGLLSPEGLLSWSEQPASQGAGPKPVRMCPLLRQGCCHIPGTLPHPGGALFAGKHTQSKVPMSLRPSIPATYQMCILTWGPFQRQLIHSKVRISTWSGWGKVGKGQVMAAPVQPSPGFRCGLSLCLVSPCWPSVETGLLPPAVRLTGPLSASESLPGVGSITLQTISSRLNAQQVRVPRRRPLLGVHSQV